MRTELEVHLAENEGHLANTPKHHSLDRHGETMTFGLRVHRPKPIGETKMQSFPVLTVGTAPAKSRPALQALQGAFGMIPNVAGTMATSPVLIDSLVAPVREGAWRQLYRGADPDASSYQRGDKR